MNFFFGTQGNLKSVKVPTTGLDRIATSFRTAGTLTNGGGFARSSVASHYLYNMNWDFIRNDQYAEIRGLFDYNTLIHFLDPQAAVSNSLPPYIAQSGDAALGGYRLVGYTGTTGIAEATTLAPEVTTGPKRTAAYTGLTGATRKQIWLPIPAGHTLWLRGLTSGTCNVSLSGGPNALLDPMLRATTMTLNGATVVDTRATSTGPNGLGFFRRTMTTANTSSPMSMPTAGTGTAATPVNDTQPWTVSWYARKSTGGPATRVDVIWYNAAGTQLTTVTGASNSVGSGWQRFSQTFSPPAGAAFLRASLVWTGTALVAQTLDFADAQLEPGSVATPFTMSLLPAYSVGSGFVPSISVPSNTAQGTTLSLTAGADITMRWLQAKVLPTGQTPDWTAGWQPGLGHSGCRLDSDPTYTLYSAPQAIDYGALNLVLRETGAWE